MQSAKLAMVGMSVYSPAIGMGVLQMSQHHWSSPGMAVIATVPLTLEI